MPDLSFVNNCCLFARCFKKIMFELFHVSLLFSQCSICGKADVYKYTLLFVVASFCCPVITTLNVHFMVLKLT